MQVNIKEGVRTVKTTQAEKNCLSKASRIARDAMAVGMDQAENAIIAIESLIEELEGQTKEEPNDPN